MFTKIGWIAGLRFGAAAYKRGQREGSVVVYEADKYPHIVIGPVQFMWKPQLGNNKVVSFTLICFQGYQC